MSMYVSVRLLLICCVLLMAGEASCAQGGGGGGGRAVGGGAGAVGGGGVGVGVGNNQGALAELAPASLVGTVFDVMIGEAKGTKAKTKARLNFATKKLTSDMFASLGVDGMTFSEKKGKLADSPVLFTASATDAKGGTVEVSGRAVGEGIKGVVTVTAKDGTKRELEFNGGKPGSDEAKKAVGTYPAESR